MRRNVFVDVDIELCIIDQGRIVVAFIVQAVIQSTTLFNCEVIVSFAN